MVAPENPYSPPSEQGNHDTSVSNVPVRNVVLEIVRAFTTIIGIMIGWVFIGAGLLNWTYGGILLGATMIGLSCMIGLGFRTGGSNARKRHE